MPTAKARRAGWLDVVAAVVMLSVPCLAVDPPHTDGVDLCVNCHVAHGGIGDPLTSIAGNANLCQSCHQAGGSASGKALSNGDQALPWPGLPDGVVASGSSHRWDAGLAGHVSFLGGALTNSTGLVFSSGVYTGAFAKTYTIRISSPGNVGTARFNWSATVPGGGSGNDVTTGAKVFLNDGISVRFVNGAGTSFQVNDQWNMYVRTDLRSPTNSDVGAYLTGGAMMCSTCHDPHSQASTPFDPAAPPYDGSYTGAGRHYMRVDNSAEQLCLDCHSPRNVTNAIAGSHPVSVPIASSAYYQATTNLPLAKVTGNMGCLTCHAVHFSAADEGSLLRMTNAASLCLECHTLADKTTPASHLNVTNGALWPGGRYGSTFPMRPGGSGRGSCMNCHQPHGWPDTANPTNHYPSLLVDREESLCYTCHDGSQSGVANIRSEFLKTNAHPVALSGVHRANEAGNPEAYGAPGYRHAECTDCHNPHQARGGYAPSGRTSYVLQGVGRVAVSNGPAGTAPAYTYLADTNSTAPIVEYQVCFKCHSSWTTLPSGSRDKAVEFNTNNPSFHPVEGRGRNATAAMASSLLGGTGLPHLTTNSTVWCSDCHNSQAIPLTVSLITNYTGTLPRGPHGSTAGSNTNMSGSLLRANYRAKLKPLNQAYAGTDFTLCYICHSSAPFSSSSGDPRAESNFRFHGLHTRSIGDNPGGGIVGDIDTPSAGRGGQGNSICMECHYTIHGTSETYYANGRSNQHLVSFSPNISGRGGIGSPVWNPTTRTCSLRCHGEDHDAENY